jgi:integrase
LYSIRFLGKCSEVVSRVQNLPPFLPPMKVTIENHRGLLRLRFNDGKRRCLPLGLSDSPIGRSLALQKKAEIELDWHTGHYDPSHLKYRPRTIGKSASEISAPELFARFTQYQTKEKGLMASTITAKYKVIERQLEQHLNLPANSIDKRAAGKLTDVWQQNIKSDTAKQRLWLLVSCWEWARGRYHVADDNPWKDLSSRFPKQPERKIDPFDADEVKKILEGFRSSNYYSHYSDFAAFLFGIGARPGEAIGLRWQNVAKDFSTVYICESMSKGVLGSTKNKISRTVALPDGLAAMLKARKEAQQPKPSDLVFTTPNGKPIDRDNFRSRAWKKVLEAAEVRYHRPYDSRATAVSAALDNGAVPLAVSQATGHSLTVMIKRYSASTNKKSVFVDFQSGD